MLASSSALRASRSLSPGWMTSSHSFWERACACLGCSSSMSKKFCCSFCQGTRVTSSAYTAHADDAAKRPPTVSQRKGYVRFSSRMNRATSASDVEVVGADHDVLHGEAEAERDLEHRAHHGHEEERRDPVAHGAELLQRLALAGAQLPEHRGEADQ